MKTEKGIGGSATKRSGLAMFAIIGTLGAMMLAWVVSAGAQAPTPKDAVTVVSSFGTLNDGATYPAESTFSAPGESPVVKMTNSGYRKQ